jgi:Sec-independent protein translocase protein TatA
LVFGAKRLPEMGRSLGAGLRGFKESITGEAPAPQPAAELSASISERATPVAHEEQVEARRAA